MIENRTLHDFARNPDGETYDGRKVAQWLFEAVTGKPMSDEAGRRAKEKSNGR